MERVGTLVRKLQQQFDSEVLPEEMLLTVRMLQAELALNGQQESSERNLSVTVDILSTQNTDAPTSPPVETKIVEVLQLDESEVEAELEEIRKAAELRNKITVQSKPVIQFDPVEDTPTLLHQTAPTTRSAEINEVAADTGTSLNDRLKMNQQELAETLKITETGSLSKLIGVNDKFQFIQELFRGDDVMYDRSIKTINGFSNLEEAEFWIKRELKLKLGWDEASAAVQQFDQLVSQRFS